ncbi:hypothetical protein ASG98_00045 [Bacillus sp. Soil531]|nr:hypothetical protein ASG98_00045 [Bacillus sp. Soil531]
MHDLSNYNTIKGIAETFELNENRIRTLIKQGKLPNTIMTIKGKQYLILIEDIEKHIELKQEVVDYVDIITAASKTNIHPETLRERIRKGSIKKTKFFLNKHYIHKEEIDLLINEANFMANYLTIQEVAKLLSCHHETVRKLIKENKFPNLLKVRNGKLFLIPKTDFNNYKTWRESCVNKKKAAQILKISIQLMDRLLDQHAFPNAHRETKTSTWSIPISDLDKFDKEKYLVQLYRPSSKKAFTNLDAMRKVKFNLSKINIPPTLKDTFTLYISFSEHYFSKSNARGDTLEKKAVYVSNTFKYLLKTLKKDIALHSDHEIEQILAKEETLGYYKEYIVKFANYCKSVTLCHFHNKYSISHKTPNEVVPYTEEEFFNYYSYIKELSVHVRDASESHLYAQTWLFIIMHFINAWRKSDIIYELPNIDFEEIGIQSIRYFEKQVLTFTQAQKIVNQVYLKVGKIEISKTGALGQFLCPKDMVLPFATAIIICELHRRKNNKETLLYSMKRGIHKKFFKHSSTLNNFHSLKMNHSLITYFFHHVMEETEDADIAYELSRNLRSHLSEDTTMIYIHSSNKDGHVNKASSHLFRRGHFGWLYNSIINLIKLEKYSLEEKTKLIEQSSRIFSPFQLERLSQFLLIEQKQHLSVIKRLLTFDKKELEDKINNILTGKSPAKVKHAQCFTHPVCSKNHDCLSCEYLIPKDYLLFSMDIEIKQLINQIKKTSMESMKIKYGYLLLNTLSILNQAVSELGREYVQTFISLESIETILEQIEDDLQLTYDFISSKGDLI